MNQSEIKKRKDAYRIEDAILKQCKQMNAFLGVNFEQFINIS